MSWKIVRLDEVCERVSVGHVGITSKYYCDDGVPFIRTQNVGTSGFDDTDIKYITPEFHAALKKSQLQGGDVLLSRVVIDEMRCAIVPKNYGQANCANVILVRPNKDLLAEYLVYLIKSPASQAYLMGKSKGAAQQVVNTGILKAWQIELPPKDVQISMVHKIESIFSEIEKATTATKAKLDELAVLKQSILQQAFNGQVVKD